MKALHARIDRLEAVRDRSAVLLSPAELSELNDALRRLLLPGATFEPVSDLDSLCMGSGDEIAMLRVAARLEAATARRSA